MLDERLLRDVFDDAVQRCGAYGVQLTVIKGDQQIDLATGRADAERGVEMTTDTAMQIGSITKVFNATVVASVVEEGLLDFDTPVNEYIPNFRVSDPEATRTLTLRHLLSMCSGLDNGRYVYFGPGEDALGRYVENLDTLKQHFPPGRFFAYANAGTCIAGHVAATVTGQPWEVLMRDRILEPAGLDSAIMLDEDVRDKRVSSGHYVLSDSEKPAVIAPVFSRDRSRGPSGSCFALTASDLARFGRMFRDRGIADTGTRILSDAMVNRMMERQIDVPSRMYANGWCVGLWTNEWDGVRQWGHAGGTPTSASMLHWIPEHDGVVAFICNTRSAWIDFQKIAFTEIYDAVFGFKKPPTSRPDGPLERVDFDRYVGVYNSHSLQWQVNRGEANTLQVRAIPQWLSEEVEGHRRLLFDTAEQSIVLTPVGSDRFLLSPLDGPDAYKGEIDTAFFGDDGSGRATNALNGLFAMSRTDD